MLLSAIVPTHERPDRLRRCLATLRDQTLDRTQFEVLVIDDGSRSDVSALVAEFSDAGGVDMRCERQPAGGLNRARNRGIAQARGVVVAFLDDDTLVAPGWAQALVDAFADPHCAAVAGRIELAAEAPVPPWIARCDYYLGAYDLGPRARWLTASDPMPVGANCAVRRDVFDALGTFAPDLDRVGGSLVSNGDTEFFQRVNRWGAAMRYQPDAAVQHCVPAERLTFRFMARRHWAQGISDELQSAIQRPTRLSDRRAVVRRALPAEARHAIKSMLGDLRAGRGAIGTALSCSYWAGRVRGAGMTIEARRHDHRDSPPAASVPAASPPL